MMMCQFSMVRGLRIKIEKINEVTTGELIKIDFDNNHELTVNGRELHNFLGVKTEYRHWFPRMVEYGFVENIDYLITTQSCDENNIDGRGRPKVDHYLTVDMAKEICMLQRTERGKQARQYFIQVEKDFKKISRY